MGLLSTIVAGGIAGALAKFILPGKRDPRGFIMTILVGIGGACLFTFIGRRTGIYDGGDTAGLIGAVIGSIILLVGYAGLKKGSG